MNKALLFDSIETLIFKNLSNRTISSLGSVTSVLLHTNSVGIDEDTINPEVLLCPMTFAHSKANQFEIRIKSLENELL